MLSNLSLVAEKYNPCEFYWQIYDVYAEASFSQKMFPNGINMYLPQQAWFKKTVYEEEKL